MSTWPSAPLLAVRGIHKRFPGVHALKGVSLDVYTGEVHALVGENGAGKSTLMHLLAGVDQPDEGTIDFDGRERVVIADEHEAQRLGIAIVFQERSLFGPLSVAENIFAGRQPVKRFGRVDWRRLHTETRQWLDQVGLAVEPTALVGDLSPAQQQMVEIAKALSLRAKLIIFDEPTAALTDTETRALFRVIADLKQRGVGVIYISHRLEEIFQIADRVTVLKDGEWQGTLPVAQTHPDDLVRRMVGRELSLHERQGRSGGGTEPAMLEVRGLTDPEHLRGARPFLRDISFSARAGEVLVLAGLAGAGRTELALALFGARPRGAGAVFIAGQKVELRSPADAIAAGLGYAPEDRKEAGLFLDMTVARNVAAGRLEQFGSWWLNERDQTEAADGFREKLRITSRGADQIVQTLSGGNQQKVVLARWLLVNPKVLIVDEPTRGIDVGAKAEVHALLRDLARQGTAVIVIASDLPEVLAVADRILVMREGRLVGEMSGPEATEEKVMRLAATSL
jgi:ABC-type sugar transport system ATPase subunit